MRTETYAISRALGRLLVAFAALFAFQCQTSRDEPTGGETHFLQRCSESSSDCGPGMVCACGVCTVPCSDASACESFPEASCVTRSEDASCDAPSAAYCDVSCIGDQDCAALSSQHRCYDGSCRKGGGSASACTSTAFQANELVVLGDSFFAADHATTAFLEDLARSRGALLPGERYRDYSSVVGNTLALLGTGIANQYSAAIAEGPVRVVLMTGGGADVLIGSCEVVTEECALLTAAANQASALFQRMAEDGVEHVVYAFYPDPSDAELRAEIAALRPLLEDACQESPIPCAWVDLRRAYAGREETYLDAEGTVPTAEGARASAAELWSVMSAGCVAQ